MLDWLTSIGLFQPQPFCVWNQTRNVDTFGLWCQLQEGVQVSPCQLLEQVEYSSPSAGTGKTVTVGTGVSETSERLSISG